MSLKHTHIYRYTVIYMGVIFLALVLRFCNFYDSVSFRGDHAWDLYVARSAVEDGRLLIVGPQLSVKGINTPSTYYYLLSLFYRMFRTPQGVTFAFACMNLLAMCCMVRLAILLIGREAGVIMAFLFATSSIMVGQSRMMWQPYPLTLGVAFSLLLLFESFQRKAILVFYLALLSYAFSMSVYISPVLLLPYYLYMGARFFRISFSCPYVFGVLFAAVSLLLAVLPFFGSYLYYEKVLGFPSYAALQTPAFGAAETFQRGYDMYLKYAVELIEDVFNFRAIKSINVAEAQHYINWSVVILMVIPRLFKKYFRGQFERMKDSVKYFFGLPWLLLGSLIILWFQKTQYVYRIHVFVPFFLLGFTFVLYLAVKSRRNVFSLLTIALLGIYTIGNISDIRSTQFTNTQSEVERASRAAMIIGSDAARSGIKTSDMGVRASYDYAIYPFIYYLRDFANYSLPYLPYSNAIDFSGIDYPNTHKYFYVICIQHALYDIPSEECERFFLGQNPGYTKVSEVSINGSDTIIKYSISPDPPENTGI